MIASGSKSNPYYSNWFTMLIKSIKSLSTDYDGMLLLDLLPIGLLFDENESQLEKLEISGYWRDQIPVKTFVTKYNNYFGDNLKNRKSKVLNVLKFCGVEYEQVAKDLTLIKMTHLWITDDSCISIDIMNTTKQKYLTILTCQGASEIQGFNCVQLNTRTNVSTLRILDYYHGISDINFVSNKLLIEAMGIDTNLQNLTFHCVTYFNVSTCNDVSLIIKKLYFYNLENVSILFDVRNSCCASDESLNQFVIKFFKILRDNIKLLKYQFKTLNIGMMIEERKTDIFSWNPNIDLQFIKNKEAEWKALKQRKFDPQQDVQREIMFFKWKNQWQ